MPLVISKKAKEISYVLNDEILGEYLGHSDFDGQNWSVGDLIIFENQSSALIEREPEGFHLWSKPKEIELSKVRQEISKFDPDVMVDIQTWEQLFAPENYPEPFQITSYRDSSASFAIILIVATGAGFLVSEILGWIF